MLKGLLDLTLLQKIYGQFLSLQYYIAILQVVPKVPEQLNIVQTIPDGVTNVCTPNISILLGITIFLFYGRIQCRKFNLKRSTLAKLAKGLKLCSLCIPKLPEWSILLNRYCWRYSKTLNIAVGHQKQFYRYSVTTFLREWVTGSQQEI